MELSTGEQTLLIIVGVVAFLFIVGFLLFRRGSFEGGFSIPGIINTWFKGRGKSDSEEIKQAGIDNRDEARVQVGDIVGGDKIGRDKIETHVHQESPLKTLPDLQLYIFDRDEELKKESTFIQSNIETPIDISFLLRLLNEAKGTFPKGIGINLEFSDRRENPSKEIKFYRPATSSRWKTHRVNISGSLPAHFSFTDPDLIGYPGQPVHDVQFRFRLPERSSGHILGQYTVSSHDPESERKGEIKVYFE